MQESWHAAGSLILHLLFCKLVVFDSAEIIDMNQDIGWGQVSLNAKSMQMS